jgi:hypothetical protein
MNPHGDLTMTTRVVITTTAEFMFDIFGGFLK